MARLTARDILESIHCLSSLAPQLVHLLDAISTSVRHASHEEGGGGPGCCSMCMFASRAVCSSAQISTLLDSLIKFVVGRELFSRLRKKGLFELDLALDCPCGGSPKSRSRTPDDPVGIE
jgi:hypothetical protein